MQRVDIASVIVDWKGGKEEMSNSNNPNQGLHDSNERYEEAKKNLEQHLKKLSVQEQEQARQKEIETQKATKRKEQDGGRKTRKRWRDLQSTRAKEQMTRYQIQRPAIRAVMGDIERVLTMAHNHEIDLPILPDRTPPHLLRWTPSYIQGKTPIDRRSRPYTALSLAQHLNCVDNSRKKGKNPRAGVAVAIALSLLALREMGVIDEGALDKMAGGLSLNSLKQLTAGLAPKKKRKK
jgi:hypothetical protein